MADFFEFLERLAADPLRRRIGSDQVRKFPLQVKKLLFQGVESGIGDERPVMDMIFITVMLDAFFKLLNSIFSFLLWDTRW